MKDGAQRRGLITMACVPTAAFYFLPTVIKTFSQQHPHIRLRIRDLTANEGLQAVARGEVEFGINLMGNSDPELSFEPLIDDPFVLAMRKDHPLAAFETIEWDQLEAYPLVVVDRSSGNRTLLDSALARHNLKLNWFYEVTHSTRRSVWSKPDLAFPSCRGWQRRRTITHSLSPGRSSTRWSPVR